MAAERKLISRYPSHCRMCGQSIEEGTVAWYDASQRRGQRMRHEACPAVAEATEPTIDARFAALTKEMLITMHREQFGTAGDTARTTKDAYVAALSMLPSSVRDALLAKDRTAPAPSAITPPAVAPVAAGDTSAEALAAAIRAIAGASVNEARVREIATEVVQQTVRPDRAITVTVENASTGVIRDMGKQHKQFPVLLSVIAAGRKAGTPLNVWLAGPAASGKTTACEKAAEALGLAFYSNGAMDTEYKVTGFVDAGGTFRDTAFYKAFSQGGLYLNDECDGNLPSASFAFHAALANGWADFPGVGMVKRHPDFVFIAAANTFGFGASSEYLGGMKQNAAFLNRFVRINWEYDEAFELELAGNTDWTLYIQSLRHKAAAKGLKVVISPRASIYGAALLAGGVSREETINLTLRNGMTEEQWANLSR